MSATISQFRPCIDLHDGQVKQIVGGTLSDRNPESLKTNFVARLVDPENIMLDRFLTSVLVLVNLPLNSHACIKATILLGAMLSNWVLEMTKPLKRPSRHGQVRFTPQYQSQTS